MVAIATEGDADARKTADHVIEIPAASELLTPDPGDRAAAAAGISHRGAARLRRGSAAEPGQERDRGMNGGLVMLAGHAIYQDGQWHGGHQNEDRLYETHLRDTFRIFADEGYQALVLSGGRSRPHLAPDIGNSEAKGMLEFAQGAGLTAGIGGEVLLEQYGRDSFENLLFSILCFHRRFGEWPSRVGAVSWKFKALRFYLIACGMKLAEGRFPTFITTDVPAGARAMRDSRAAACRCTVHDHTAGGSWWNRCIAMHSGSGPRGWDALHRNTLVTRSLRGG